jgi:hypothetical protein
VDQVWEFVEGVDDLELLRYERLKARVNAALDGLSDDEVFAEIQSRWNLAGASPKTVKQAELETLVASRPELGEDKPDGTFFARALPSSLHTFWRSRGHWRSCEVVANSGACGGTANGAGGDCGW